MVRVRVLGTVRQHMADAVTLSRLALVVPWVWCEVSAPGKLWPSLIMAAIVGSDLLDGAIARRLGTACERGAILDAMCDTAVVVAASVTLGFDDARYFGLAGFMAAAFVSWGAYSLVIRQFGRTRLGRHDGAVCFALVTSAGAWPRAAAFGASVPAVAEWVAICVVVGVLGASATENVIEAWRAVVRARARAAAAGAAGSQGRSSQE